MTKLAVSRRNGPKISSKCELKNLREKQRQIGEFLVSFDWAKFKSRKKFVKLKGNREIAPL